MQCIQRPGNRQGRWSLAQDIHWPIIWAATLNSVVQTPWAHNPRWWWVLWQSYWNTKYRREGLLSLTWRKREHWKNQLFEIRQHRKQCSQITATKSQTDYPVLLGWSSARQERHQPQCHCWIHRLQLSKISKSNYKQEMSAAESRADLQQERRVQAQSC